MSVESGLTIRAIGDLRYTTVGSFVTEWLDPAGRFSGLLDGVVEAQYIHGVC